MGGTIAHPCSFFFKPLALRRLSSRDDPHRDRRMMRSPTALVAATLVMAILVAAPLLIVTGARGADAPLHHLNAPAYDHS